MSKVRFTPEQQEMLRNNQYTVRITADTLSLSKEFKELFYREYLSGAIPREILQKYGYPAEVLGQQRVWGITQCIKKEFKRNGSFRDIRFVKAARPSVPKTTDEKIRKLEHQMDYLTQEVEFLKKISSIRNTGK